MSRRRVVASGIAVVVVYIAALGVTVGLRAAHVRPLYDGVAPPPAYSWVDPPAFFASGNVEPSPTSAVVSLGPNGSDAAGIASPDGQFAIDLARGAFAGHGSDRQIKVAITPVAPKHLAAVSDGLRPNGNAYRVVMTYEPSNAPVTAITKPGSLLIEIPELGDHLFRSATGQTWSRLPAQVVPPRELSLSAAFRGSGYYLAATNLPELEGPSTGSSHRALELGVVTAVLALAVLLLAAFVVRRRRRVGAA